MITTLLILTYLLFCFFIWLATLVAVILRTRNGEKFDSDIFHVFIVLSLIPVLNLVLLIGSIFEIIDAILKTEMSKSVEEFLTKLCRTGLKNND